MRMFPMARRAGVGVMDVTGVLGAGGHVQAQAELIERMKNGPRFKSVLLNIDSPGGSVGASEFLYSCVRSLARKKPVVAFIRGTGASGAYMISSAATRIVALPSALVGSIGVISARPILKSLMERMGIEMSVYKGGRLKDMGGFWRGPTPEENDHLQALVKELYDSFVSLVAGARHLPADRMTEIATGEVFTGKRAKELGLVDEVADIDRALDLAAELGQARRNPIRVRPKVSLTDRLLGRYLGLPPHQTMEGTLAGLAAGIYYLSPIM